jgi:hypothetical protein
VLRDVTEQVFRDSNYPRVTMSALEKEIIARLMQEHRILVEPKHLRPILEEVSARLRARNGDEQDFSVLTAGFHRRQMSICSSLAVRMDMGDLTTVQAETLRDGRG